VATIDGDERAFEDGVSFGRVSARVVDQGD
jgi:hypothetical protein